MEPQYNADLLRSDPKYRFAQIDALTAFMAQIEPYEERVKYFFRTSEAMGLSLHGLDPGNIPIYNGKEPTRDPNADKWVDEYGNVPTVKYWDLKGSQEQRKLLRKMWFLEQRHNEFKTFGHWKNQTLDQLKKAYTGKPGKVYAERELASIENEISRFIADWSKANTGNRITEEVKAQQKDAPILIERELLNKENAIDWLAFYRYNQLEPFAFLWDMVTYKLFLFDEINRPSPVAGQPENASENDPPKLSFTDRFQNSFTKEKFDRLLGHMRVINGEGQTVLSEKKRYLMHSIIDALLECEYITSDNRDEMQKAFSRYLGIDETRIKNGYATGQSLGKERALSYLKKEHE